jgi:hypothetical protein
MATTTSSRSSTPLRPFTIPHFRAYVRNPVLDNGREWELEDFQDRIVRDLFAGVRELWSILPEAGTIPVAGAYFP